MLSPPTLPERLGADLLSDETRKQRRNLDVVAVLALLVVVLDLIPTRISAVGVDLGEPDQERFLWVLAVFDVAFLVLFVVYAASDFVQARPSSDRCPRSYALSKIKASGDSTTSATFSRAPAGHEETLREIGAQASKIAAAQQRARSLALLRRLGYVRFGFDFVLPVALGVAAAVALGVKIAAE
jgi:hypothetical protein